MESKEEKRERMEQRQYMKKTSKNIPDLIKNISPQVKVAE